jgi:hypothetical protein
MSKAKAELLWGIQSRLCRLFPGGKSLPRVVDSHYTDSAFALASLTVSHTERLNDLEKRVLTAAAGGM